MNDATIGSAFRSPITGSATILITGWTSRSTAP
jgi:hypothetical protein